ncbi:MAG: MotA/TolQ/ExbB proton channel family protein [Planctomycetes bacterium]|nr:MotA/TolQ/ExbB proton channel family protein [Planctomycetota bacterium]
MAPRRSVLLLLLLLPVMVLAVTAPGWAQDVSPVTAESTVEKSFASHFFIATRTDPDRGTHVELLGSLIIWFLLVLSVLSISLIGRLAVSNQRKTIVPAAIVDEARRLLLAGEYRAALELATRDPSDFSRMLRAALKDASHGFAAVIRSLEQTADELATERMRRVEYLNVLGQVSPMIGLFGTVYGMILAFQAIVAAGGNADPVLLAGGIGTALTTTFWGLIVAIPALAGYGIIRNTIDELSTEAIVTAEDLLKQFRPRPGPGPARRGDARTSSPR